jgi:hypothetical protein
LAPITACGCEVCAKPDTDGWPNGRIGGKRTGRMLA